MEFHSVSKIVRHSKARHKTEFLGFYRRNHISLVCVTVKVGSYAVPISYYVHLLTNIYELHNCVAFTTTKIYSIPISPQSLFYPFVFNLCLQSQPLETTDLISVPRICFFFFFAKCYINGII